jgi:hypothetical protein
MSGAGSTGATPSEAHRGDGAGLVLDRHRPTLRDLLAQVPRRRRPLLWAAAAVLCAALAAGAWLLVFEAGDRGTEYVHRGAPAFNFAYPADLEPVRPQGTDIVRLERRREDGLFLDSFAVSPLSLPAYGGDAGGFLPAYADREIAALRRRHPEFELVQEGKTRVIETSGYAIVWQARQGERRLYGRTVLLPEPVPGARRGARLEILATPAAGAGNAGEAGSRGATKRPYRTFRFGTEGP